MRGLELKIPPVGVLLLAGGGMWLIAWFTPAWRFVLPGRLVMTAVACVAGVTIAGSGVWSFRHAETTINPMKPESSSALVASGIYRWTRNPMYLGLLWILLGWGIYLSNAPAYLVLPGFVLYMNRFQIEPEERALTRIFGPAFAAYRAHVRKWI